MATKPAEEAPQPLKYQTWVMKVSIHCEGCKKKVIKVLKGVDGVYTIDVDSQQHKVTVTGNVEAETLIKKLLRSGKHAELWPEKPEKKDKKPGKTKNNDKQKEAKDDEEVGDDNKMNTTEKPENAAAGESPPELDLEDGESDEASGGNGGSSEGKKKKKKKKKKGQTGNSGTGVGENAGDAPAGKGSPMATPEPIPSTATMNLYLPHDQEYSYPPPMYYAPPMHGVSYITTYPRASTSYYAPAMHAYSSSDQPRRYVLAPPPDPIHRFYDDYHHDDDDHEVGCSIM